MGMYISDKLAKAIQDYIDGRIKVMVLVEVFQEAGFRKGGSMPPSTMTALTAAPPPNNDFSISNKQRMITILEHNKVDPHRFPLSVKARNFCMSRQDVEVLSDDQNKFLNDLWGDLTRELAR